MLKFRRDNERHADFHIANMGGEAACIEVVKPATDIDGAGIAPGTLELAPFACVLLRFAK